ncbi:hypothetical protein EIP91_000911 [Steccherinum ochraceum]|uniref:Glycerophosphocholine acyltransferase 1 n=1 Tax=Steccherinum ochraceum TaxID=92696 RepID=A0A4R0RJ18_9APHY|nr:hypothetical protein EIP91_000911 [Steccherinum ochraceum]
MSDSSISQPPSPDLRPSTPGTPGNMSGLGYFSVPFERFVKDEISDWASGFTLMDTVETYFDSRLDLLQRRLSKHSDRLKLKAESKFNDVLKKDVFKIKSNGDLLTNNLEKEMQKFKLKMTQRMTSLSASWQSAKIVRTREKVTFFGGVMSLFITAVLLGMAPDWIHIFYTFLAILLLPLRIYIYKKRAWHYFLFDLCYYANILNFVWIWAMPDSPALFTACYCLSHGSLASAVITWRNSLVFHDFDKVTSLFIHIYPPLTFTVIRHYYPNPEERFPALAELPRLNPVRSLLLASIIYSIWQLLYWKVILINRRKKIESGQRITSFSWLLNDKRGVIGRMLSAIKPENREWSFMLGQLVYSIITELPAVFLLYDSKAWSAVYLMVLFSVCVWNGGGFYIEVFGRKFERQLEALRKELAEAYARSSSSAPTSPILAAQSDDGLSTVGNSPSLGPVPDKTVSQVELPMETVPDLIVVPAEEETKKDQ